MTLDSHRAAARELLQRAARQLLADGHSTESEALNLAIETHYPKPPALEGEVYTSTACSFHRCPCPSRCKPVGCIQNPNVEQPPLSLTP